MAKIQTITVVDDLNGSKADETVHFSLDGIRFEIDLSSSNAAELRAALEPWISAGRRTGGRHRRTRLGS